MTTATREISPRVPRSPWHDPGAGRSTRGIPGPDGEARSPLTSLRRLAECVHYAQALPPTQPVLWTLVLECSVLESLVLECSVLESSSRLCFRRPSAVGWARW